MALSNSMADSGGLFFDEREARLEARRQKRTSQGESSAAAAASSLAASSSSSQEEEEEEDDGYQCEDGAGYCSDADYVFTGPPRSRPDPNEPECGWGHTACCGKPAHFNCLGRWLQAQGREEVESSRGMIRLGERQDGSVETTCPFCRAKLSRSTNRMMRTV